MSKVVIKSYYIIKLKGYAGNKDKFVASGLNNKKPILISNKDKATRFEYFGLKGMEKSLKIVMSFISDLRKGNDKGWTILGGDIEADLKSIEDIGMLRNMLLWSNVINDNAIDGVISAIIELSKDEDEEPTESYADVYKFLSHVKRLKYGDIMDVANNWNRLDDMTQSELAIGYAGEYSASRFMMFMDYLNVRLEG